MPFIIRKNRVLASSDLCTRERLDRALERARLAPIDGDEKELSDKIDKALIALAESTRLRDAPLWLVHWWANSRMRKDNGQKFVWEEGAGE